jgi:aspartate kinase
MDRAGPLRPGRWGAVVARTGKIAIGGLLETRGLVLVRVLGARRGPGSAGRTLSALGRHGINVLCVVCFADLDRRDNICFAINRADLDQTLGLMQIVREEIEAETVEVVRNCCVVSVYGPHFSERPSVAGLIFDAMAGAGVEVHAISTSISTVSCVIDEDRIEEVAARLNETFLLP